MNDNAAPYAFEDYATEQTRRMLEHVHRASLALFQGKPGIARDRLRKSRLCALRAAAWLRAQPDPNTLEGSIMIAVRDRVTADMEHVLINGDADGRG